MSQSNHSELGLRSDECLKIFEDAFANVPKVDSASLDVTDQFIIENGMSEKDRAALCDLNNIFSSGVLPADSERRYEEIFNSLQKLA